MPAAPPSCCVWLGAGPGLWEIRRAEEAAAARVMMIRMPMRIVPARRANGLDICVS